jgi:hypothetical protein
MIINEQKDFREAIHVNPTLLTKIIPCLLYWNENQRPI